MCLYIVVAIQIQVIPVKEQLKSLNSSENGFVASTGKSINNRVVSDNFVIIRPELLLLLRNVLFFDPYYPDIPRESSFYPCWMPLCLQYVFLSDVFCCQTYNFAAHTTLVSQIEINMPVVCPTDCNSCGRN